MMAVDSFVSLWTCLCNSGKVLDILCHFCVHDKLNYVSLWDTYHVVCAYTQNFVDIFYHGVFLYLLMLLEISNNPCFLVLQICLWEPFLPISDKQSTTQFCSFWSIFCNMLLSLKETTLWFHNWVTSYVAVISSNMPLFFARSRLSFVFGLVLN